MHNLIIPHLAKNNMWVAMIVYTDQNFDNDSNSVSILFTHEIANESEYVY